VDIQTIGRFVKGMHAEFQVDVFIKRVSPR